MRKTSTAFTLTKWGDGVRGDALRPERKGDLAFQIVIPAHCLLFRSGIDNRFVVDAVLPGPDLAWVFSWPCFQDSADGGAAYLHSTGDFGFADASTV